MNWIELKIIEIREETGEYVSIIFQKPREFSFVLGECFSFRFPGDSSSRVFSFASSPTESVIIISYRKGVSSFKKRLETVKVGDTMEVSLYGSQFHFQEKKPALFIAGGIGITAFRSIIKYCLDSNVDSPLHLIFINRTEEFPFHDEFEAWKKTLHLSVTYLVTNQTGRLTKQMLSELVPSKNEDIYIAGPPLMIDHTVLLLSQIGVKEKYIHTESFDGYTDEV